ncbi:hypothetical protein RRG08_008486 [Elysia crispata]|uniref:Uncharacterized protein n=1 Tax=Elysia crispata TaxID=231223 RepID=A0AAE0Z9R1_9GAST|nr:hypothetical protein RRG08_008486 [Elysia crispata]
MRQNSSDKTYKARLQRKIILCPVGENSTVLSVLSAKTIPAGNYRAKNSAPSVATSAGTTCVHSRQTPPREVNRVAKLSRCLPNLMLTFTSSILDCKAISSAAHVCFVTFLLTATTGAVCPCCVYCLRTTWGAYVPLIIRLAGVLRGCPKCKIIGTPRWLL